MSGRDLSRHAPGRPQTPLDELRSLSGWERVMVVAGGLAFALAVFCAPWWLYLLAKGMGWL